MKKVFILLLILGFSVPVISAEYDPDSKQKPSRQMQDSFEEQDRICKDVASNFRLDPKFSGYIRNQCNLYTADRARTVATLFSSKRQVNGENTKDGMARFIIEKDLEQIKKYKQIADEYCQYSDKLSKKDPRACERVNDIFADYDFE